MTATVQLQRELLETVLEEKTERMQAIAGLLDSISELRQDNAALRKDNEDLHKDNEDLRRDLNVLQGGPPPPPPLKSDSTEPPAELGIKELRDRIEALEAAQANRDANIFPTPKSPHAPLALPASPTEEELAASQAEDAEKGNEMEYELKESMWDLAILIGLPGMGWLGSLHAALLLFANICAQTLFCLLAQFNFTAPEFDEGTVEDIRAWRIGTAHDYTHIDSLTNKALLTRVCGEDSSLYISSGQLDMFSQIISYLPEFDIEPLEGVPDWKLVDTMRENLNGVVMCVLAVSCYHLTIIREFHAIWDKMKVFTTMPRGRTTILSHELEFQRIAVVRYVSIASIAGLRLLLVLSLLWTGTLFLVHDIGVGDLLLNAVALEFVLNVDELIYEALAPVSGKLFLSKIKPLEVPHTRFRYKGMDMKGVFFTILVPTMVMIAYLQELDPMVQQVREAFEIMCGEQGKHFVYETSLDGFVSVALSTTDDDDRETISIDQSTGNPELEDLFKALQAQAVESLVYGSEFLLDSGDSLDSANTTAHFNDISDLPEWGTLTFPALVEKFTTDCEDMLNSDSGIFKQVKYLFEQLFSLGADYQDRTLNSCADLADLCVTYEDPPGAVSWNTLARFACPETCGCVELLGRFPYMPESDQGCSVQCEDKWNDGSGGYDLQVLLCNDWSVDELQGSDWWEGWTSQEWAQEMVGNGTNAQGIGVLYEDGCDMIPSVLGVGSLQGVTAQSIYDSEDYQRACYGALAKDFESIYSHKPLIGVCPKRCGCFPDPANGMDSFQKEYSIYNQLVNTQGVTCPTTCTLESQLGCSAVPNWVCDTSADSESTDDYVFVNEEGFTVWDESCTKSGSQFDVFTAQMACYDCRTEPPLWLCDTASSMLDGYQQGGTPQMPSDIFVYQGSEGTRADGSDVKAHYAYCNQSTSQFNRISDNDAGFQSYRDQVAYWCYRWVCTSVGGDFCKYCSSDNGIPVNQAGWTFNCSESSSDQGGPGDGGGGDNSSSSDDSNGTTTPPP